MNKKDMIVEGYKGIMDLDLSLVPEKFIKIAVDQHLEDIKEYKKYQSQLKPHLRYENTVARNELQLKKDKQAQQKRIKSVLKKPALEDQKRAQSFYEKQIIQN